MAQRVTITAKVLVTVEYEAESGVYVSHCPILKVYSQGESEDEAKEAIQEAVMMYLKAAHDFNKLDSALRRSGFNRFKDSGVLDFAEQYVTVTSETLKSFEIEVPLTLVAAAANNQTQWQHSH